MRHWLRLALCGGALAALLTCGAAATDDYTTDANGGTVDYDSASGVYTASYDGAQDGNQYAILVVKGTYENGVADYSISEDTIMYIDQKAADSSGVSFDFIPRSTPDCVVLLGGEFDGAESPVVLGTLVGKGATVEVPEASISFAGTTAPTLSLETADGTSYSFAEQGGSYSAAGVPDGTYTLTIRKKSHMPYTATFVIENGIPSQIPNISLLAGDTDEDGRINSIDIGNLISVYLGDASQDSRTDIDENGYINSIDLGFVLGNYLKSYEEN